MHAIRGFQDLPDYREKIEPTLQKARAELEHNSTLSREGKTLQYSKIRRRLIDEIRMRKKPENAQVVQGLFPLLPFQDRVFKTL